MKMTYSKIKNIFVSPAKISNLRILEHLWMSLVQIKKSNGSRMKPCLTPQVRDNNLDTVLFTAIQRNMSIKYVLKKKFNVRPHIPYKEKLSY